VENKTVEMVVKDLLLADNQKKKRCMYSRGFRGDEASNDSVVVENVDFQGFRALRLRHLRK